MTVLTPTAWTISHDGACRRCDKPCPTVYQPICATRNGIKHTIINECYLERVRCRDPTISKLNCYFLKSHSLYLMQTFLQFGRYPTRVSVQRPAGKPRVFPLRLAVHCLWCHLFYMERIPPHYIIDLPKQC